MSSDNDMLHQRCAFSLVKWKQIL